MRMTQYAQTVYCSHTYYVKAVRNECILSDLNWYAIFTIYMLTVWFNMITVYNDEQNFLISLRSYSVTSRLHASSRPKYVRDTTRLALCERGFAVLPGELLIECRLVNQSMINSTLKNFHWLDRLEQLVDLQTINSTWQTYDQLGWSTRSTTGSI